MEELFDIDSVFTDFVDSSINLGIELTDDVVFSTVIYRESASSKTSELIFSLYVYIVRSIIQLPILTALIEVFNCFVSPLKIFPCHCKLPSTTSNPSGSKTWIVTFERL